MLACPRGERQSGKDQRQQQQLGDLEGAAQRPVEKIAADDVRCGQRHQAKQQDRRGGSQPAIEPGAGLCGVRCHGPRLCHLPAATRLTSSRNSASTLAPSTPLALAALIQLSSSGLVLSRTPLASSGEASSNRRPYFFISSRPARSASSQDLPTSRASASPERERMASWSSLGSLFHLSSFMKKPNAEL